MTRTPLSDEQLRASLATLPRWTGDRRGITREIRFASYEAGVAFAMQVALVAQRMDHHPDITIGWQRVVVTYTTHDAGGVSARDFDAARAVDAFAPDA